MAKNITVFGATGMIGKPVTIELIKAGFQVTALVRNVEKAKQMFPAGIQFVKGDLQDTRAIAEAMKNADAIYINISTTSEDKENVFNPEMQGLDNILQVAKQTPSVKQVAYLSSFLAKNYTGNWWVMNAKKSSIERVKQTNIPYTIFYPSNFMENFANGMVRDGKITLLSASVNNKFWWIAGEDFGRQVAAALQTEKTLNKEYAVQGLEALTMHEAAEKYVNSYTKNKLSIGTLPLWVMKVMGFFIPSLRFVANLMNVMLNNGEVFMAENTWEELGKPQITIEKFAKS